MDGARYVCMSCGVITHDVYWNEPGTWIRLRRPICASCYERGWLFYWRERSYRDGNNRASVKAVRTALFRKR